MKKIKLLCWCLLPIALLSVAAGFWHGLSYMDFHWESAALFLRGENPYQYFFDGKEYCGTFVDAVQAPSTIAFILPYGMFSHYVGNLLWDVSNIVFLIAFLYFIFKLWFKDDPHTLLLLGLVFASGTPWRVCIGNGQHVMFSLMFFIMAYYAMEKHKPWWVIGFLMAASLFKYTVTVPLAFIFLYRRQWKAMFLCAAIHIGTTVALGLWTGCNPIQLVLQSMKIGAVLNSHGGSADLAGALYCLGVQDVNLFALAGYIVFGVLLFIYAFAGKDDHLLKLATFSVIANVMFYHRVYDFVTLIFPLVYVIKNWRNNSKLEYAIRMGTFMTIMYAFFFEKFLTVMKITFGPVGAVLQHALLVLLLLHSFLPADQEHCGRTA